jgi:hypothetical protein
MLDSIFEQNKSILVDGKAVTLLKHFNGDKHRYGQKRKTPRHGVLGFKYHFKNDLATTTTF